MCGKVLARSMGDLIWREFSLRKSDYVLSERELFPYQT